MVQPALGLAKRDNWRAGFEDAPFGCQLSNLQLVEEAVSQIHQAGFEIVAPARTEAG
jgi:hypothetical protein